MSDKIVYLMRGLPSCGKSHTAKILAGETGVICETDEYFYTQVGEDPTQFDYQDDLLETARQWNFERFCRAVEEGRSPIVVDRGNSLSIESQQYARFAVDRGYRVELAEPKSDWWQEIRVLLKHKKYTLPVLKEWAAKLSKMNRQTHRVSAEQIFRWMEKWRWEVTIEDILNYRPSPAATTNNSRAA